MDFKYDTSKPNLTKKSAHGATLSDDMFSETLGDLSDTIKSEDCDTEEKQADEGKKENDKVEIVDITKEILRPGLSFKTKESAKKSLQRIFMLVFV